LNEDNSGLLLAVRDPGSCFASRIPLLLRNGATKYQATISIVRQAPRKINATDLQTTFALLIEKYAELGNEYRHSDGRPNNSSIYKKMSGFNKNSTDVSGMQERTIVERISQAQSVKHGKADGHLSLLKQKRLQITLACFTDAYAAKIDCLNKDRTAELTKIAENLADENIARQDAESIKQRLEEAYEVRQNPDKPKY
jgi:hypothetical protein